MHAADRADCLYVRGTARPRVDKTRRPPSKYWPRNESDPAASARTRRAFGHTLQHLFPDLLHGEQASLSACHRLYISRNALLYPMMLSWHVGETHMSQFVGHCPVVL